MGKYGPGVEGAQILEGGMEACTQLHCIVITTTELSTLTF